MLRSLGQLDVRGNSCLAVQDEDPEQTFKPQDEPLPVDGYFG